MPIPLALGVTFSITPQNLIQWTSASQFARASACGFACDPFPSLSFGTQYADNKLYFPYFNAADPALDYTTWENIKKVPHIKLEYDLSSLGEHKELALVFNFEVVTWSRLLVYTYNGILGDVTLFEGDNQFLLEVESLDPLDLYFIHTKREGINDGGSWFFKGIAGYVV